MIGCVNSSFRQNNCGKNNNKRIEKEEKDVKVLVFTLLVNLFIFGLFPEKFRVFSFPVFGEFVFSDFSRKNSEFLVFGEFIYFLDFSRKKPEFSSFWQV